MKTKIRLALIIGVFMSICMAILIYHQAYVSALAELIVLGVFLNFIYRIKS